MNYYGADKKMHRGVLIVRSDLTGEIKYAFSRSLSVRFPITKMDNPNALRRQRPRADGGGQLQRVQLPRAWSATPTARRRTRTASPSTSTRGRTPTGTSTGKWWPSNGTAYIDRTPRRAGMLSLKSTMVKALRSDGFFWGGLWYPGRDYQHFQY